MVETFRHGHDLIAGTWGGERFLRLCHSANR